MPPSAILLALDSNSSVLPHKSLAISRILLVLTGLALKKCNFFEFIQIVTHVNSSFLFLISHTPVWLYYRLHSLLHFTLLKHIWVTFSLELILNKSMKIYLFLVTIEIFRLCYRCMFSFLRDVIFPEWPYRYYLPTSVVVACVFARFPGLAPLVILEILISVHLISFSFSSCLRPNAVDAVLMCNLSVLNLCLSAHYLLIDSLVCFTVEF